MNIKYRIEFTDDLGLDWKVHIKEEGATGVIDYTATGSPLMFEGYGDDDPFNQLIQGSKVSINIWNPQDFVLLELFSAEILQFKVVVYLDDVLYWQGFILPEAYQERYNQAPLETSIVAADGFGLLKEFQFDDLEYEFTRQTFSQAVYDILSLIGINGFTEYVNVYHSGMSSGVGDSPLTRQVLIRNSLRLIIAIRY